MVTTDPHDYLPVAHAAADLARDLIRTSHPGAFTEKADRDLVSTSTWPSSAPPAALHPRHPRHRVPRRGRRRPRPTTGTGWLWTLDPIDGTSNYAHGIPLCAASLALLRDGRPVLGVIDAPFMAERFHAAEGQAHGRRPAAWPPAPTTELRDAIVAIGDYATGPGAARKNETQLAATVSLTPRVHRIRMLGTAALDLAWVAAGRLDASITFSNHPWDMAAGIILAREAGAAVTDADGTPHTLFSAATIAAAPALSLSSSRFIQAASKRDPRRRQASPVRRRRPRRDPQPRPLPHLRLRRTRPRPRHRHARPDTSTKPWPPAATPGEPRPCSPAAPRQATGSTVTTSPT